MEGDGLSNEIQLQSDGSSPDVSQDAFEGAYDGALQGVLYSSQYGTAVSGTVALDSDQWQQLSDSLRVLTSVSLFTMCLCAALLGALVLRTLVEGWRR